MVRFEIVRNLFSLILFGMGTFIGFYGLYDHATFLIATAVWMKV